METRQMTDTPSPHREHPRIGTFHGRLAGKRALVTGSTRGLGRTTAEWLAREGASIFASGRDEADVDETIAALRALGVDAWGAPADLARTEEAHRLAKTALETAGPFDILVNNAGMSIQQHFTEVSDAQWDEQVNVNMRAPFILSQHIARAMIAEGIRGRIVNISTIGVFAAHTRTMVYDMAKGGIQAMTRAMAYELGRHGISANCIAPGAVPDRPGTRDNADAPPFEIWNDRIPMGRLGRAEDIAAAVVYFCLPESAWTTGQTLLIDGGHISYLRED
jgi:NAD(P)-dependent dehydrogenase (short-subunit alcohol dehydrogenase family)